MLRQKKYYFMVILTFQFTAIKKEKILYSQPPKMNLSATHSLKKFVQLLHTDCLYAQNILHFYRRVSL